jgi:hypothetical protein
MNKCEVRMYEEDCKLKKTINLRRMKENVKICRNDTQL